MQGASAVVDDTTSDASEHTDERLEYSRRTAGRWRHSALILAYVCMITEL